MDVQGYDTCRCGELHPTIALARSAGTCPKCEHQVFDQVREMEIQQGGSPLVLRLLPKKRNRGKPSDNAKLAAAARMAAMRRLKNLFPQIYAVVYAEERAKRGLESFPIEGQPLSATEVDEALREVAST